MTRFKLHIAEVDDFSSKVLEGLRARFDVTTGHVEVNELKNLLQKVDAFWFRLAYRLDEQVLNHDTRCKYLVSPVTGIDHIDQGLCKELGIDIICLKGEFEFLKEVRATAEHTLNLAMSLMRKIVPAAKHASGGEWDRDLFRGSELYKKRVGIVGFGRLGKICADLFTAFGCEVYIYDIIEHDSCYRQVSSIADLIEMTDIISLHVSYDESTHHLISKGLIDFFTSTKYLINTSRGGLIDEVALLSSLERGRIGGAALDVLYGEPNIASHPLVHYASQNDNLLLTPHIGGNTFESFAKTEEFIAAKLIRAIDAV